MDAIVLCGGKGTRLSAVVNKVPKPLAPIGGRPFLDYLLMSLANSGIVSRVILATGHLAQRVEDQYGTAFGSLPIVYSCETESLGTGGAVLLALGRYTISSPFLLLNGDSFIDAEFNSLIGLLGSAEADFAMALYRVEDASRFGTVELSGNRVIGFVEKAMMPVGGLINAGVYLTKPEAFSEWMSKTGPLSLEIEVLPRLISKGKVVGVESGKHFIDIGLPETYREATSFFGEKLLM